MQRLLDGRQRDIDDADIEQGDKRAKIDGGDERQAVLRHGLSKHSDFAAIYDGSEPAANLSALFLGSFRPE
ncbi:hypothetical protein MesoLj113b_23790 [Mesorhizobium sp. 113-3-3]|nr:hypothetical protein MesoLj113b_23790 [Mesorhizobium sp. 113-3-3]